MGRAACEWIEGAEDLSIAARIGSADPLEEQLASCGADVGIDLTVAGLGRAHGLALLGAGIPAVIGTSGMSAEDDEALDRAAHELGLGGLVVPNFSLGVWLLNKACEEAARYLPDFEILELHNARKQDAPSGTALDTAARLASVRGDRSAGDVPIHSVRLPGLYSNQEVLFGAPGELLRLRHETYALECFAPGLLAALRYAPRALGVRRGIGHALEAPDS